MLWTSGAFLAEMADNPKVLKQIFDDASVTMKPVALWRKINAMGAPAREAIQALGETEKVTFYKHLSKFEDDLYNFASIQSDEIDAIGCWNAIKGKLDELGEGAEAIEKAKFLLTDLKNYPELVGPFKGNAGLVEAWKSLFSKPDWRINTGYLSKVNRYADEGIDIVEEGGKLKAKTANDLEIGELDIDALEEVAENALKVKGKFSGRHFDPDLSGGVIVRKAWQNTSISQAGIDDVITHTGRFDDILGENALMIDRLQKIKNGEISITDFDIRYYTHELEEYARYKNLGIADGVDPGNAVWNNAHSATLEVYSITDEASLIFH